MAKKRKPTFLWQFLAHRFDHVDHHEPCWIWLGATNSRGYGYRTGKALRPALTHRYFYEWFKGPIPDGLTIDHLCRNKRCCNPAHMEPVTAEENTSRARCADLIRGNAEIEPQPAKKGTPAYGRIIGQRFSDQDVRMMRTLSKGPLTYRQIAYLFDASYSYTRSVCKGVIRKSAGG